MAIVTRVHENEYDEPTVVIVVTGTHEVSRLVNLFRGMALVEHVSAGDKLVKQLRRTTGGKAALDLLKRHGGPDLTQGGE